MPHFVMISLIKVIYKQQQTTSNIYDLYHIWSVSYIDRSTVYVKLMWFVLWGD